MKWWRQRRKHRVLIVYKTGFRIVVRCRGYTFTRNAFDELTEVNLDAPRPRPAYLNVRGIATAYRL